MALETGVQSQVESYQRLKKWYLIPPCLTLSIIRYISRVKCSNPGKGVVPSSTPPTFYFYLYRSLISHSHIPVGWLSTPQKTSSNRLLEFIIIIFFRLYNCFVMIESNTFYANIFLIYISNIYTYIVALDSLSMGSGWFCKVMLVIWEHRSICWIEKRKKEQINK